MSSTEHILTIRKCLADRFESDPWTFESMHAWKVHQDQPDRWRWRSSAPFERSLGFEGATPSGTPRLSGARSTAWGSFHGLSERCGSSSVREDPPSPLASANPPHPGKGKGGPPPPPPGGAPPAAGSLSGGLSAEGGAAAMSARPSQRSDNGSCRGRFRKLLNLQV